MKKQITITLIFILLGSFQVSTVALANPIPYPATPSPEKPTLAIETPQNNASYFNTNSIALNFSVAQPDSWYIDYDFFFHLGQVTGIEVSLDGKLSSYPYNSTSYSIMLDNLTLGMHEINVTVQAYSFYTDPIYGSNSIPVNGSFLYQYPINVSDTVYFTIEPPKISILSPQTTTYNETSVSLVYSINGTTSQIYYTLDGQKSTSDTGNSTLTNLSNGSHNVTVYATDEAGNMGNQTVYFTVAKPAMAFPTLSVAVSVVIIVMATIVASTLLYRMHKNHNLNKKSILTVVVKWGLSARFFGFACGLLHNPFAS
jgi:hypothetical protein